MLINNKISTLLNYFVDGTELSKEDFSFLFEHFLIEEIYFKNQTGYALTITGKAMLKIINKS